ncbi:hypothetical protein OC844_005547 [Tilletia horrida]|nr:hypothetical protein OC844_005547 [Tilletia horrida]
MEVLEHASSRTDSTGHGPSQDLTPSTAHFPQTPTIKKDAPSDIVHNNNEVDENAPSKEPASAPSQQQDPPRQYSFWAPEIAKERKAYLTGIAQSTFLITLLIWGVLSIYWGSLWKATSKTGSLDGWIINRDGADGVIGNATTSVLLQSKLNDEPMHLNWQVINPSDYPTAADIEQAIAVDEKAWIAVEVTQDVSARLFSARANGDASWSPEGQVVMYVSEARSNTVIPGYVVAPTQRRLQTALSTLAAQLAGQYLTQVAGNATALQALARAPQTISNPVIPVEENLRPWSQPVATAPTFVGLIYLVIITLNVTLGNFNFRQGIQNKLKIRSLIAMRFLVPFIIYFVLAMMYTMLNLPFKLDFNGWHLGFGAGFMTFFVATWCGMLVLGLTVECAVSLIGPQFIGFFLVLLIIANVSVVVFPIPLTPHFYRYGYALPFPHLRAIYTTIVFNTGRHILLLYHFGVLWAWLLVIALTFPIWIVLERKGLTLTTMKKKP